MVRSGTRGGASGLRFLPGHCRCFGGQFSASLFSFCDYLQYFTSSEPPAEGCVECVEWCGEWCIAAARLVVCLYLELLLLAETQVVQVCFPFFHVFPL